MADEIQQVQVEEPIKGHTVFSFNHPTPMWATWAFRTEFIINKALTMYLAGTNTIPQGKIKEWMLVMSIIDFIVWFLARSLGVKKADIEKEFA